MVKYTKRIGRNSEIVTFFYAIFGHRIHQGVEQGQARKEAYDAVSLRYGVSRGRLLNIISDQNNSQKVNMTAFRENIITLIADVEAANEEITSTLNSTLENNGKLLALLKDCLDYVDR